MKTFPLGSQVLPRKPSREKIRFPFDRRAGLSSAKGDAGTEEEESEGNDISSWTGAELFMTARFLQSAFFFLHRALGVHLSSTCSLLVSFGLNRIGQFSRVYASD